MCNITRESPSALYTTDAVVIDASAQAKQVAGEDPQRRSVTVINDPEGTQPAYLVARQSDQARSGIKLMPGAGLSLNTSAAVWVIHPTGGTVFVVTEGGALV